MLGWCVDKEFQNISNTSGLTLPIKGNLWEMASCGLLIGYKPGTGLIAIVKFRITDIFLSLIKKSS